MDTQAAKGISDWIKDHRFGVYPAQVIDNQDPDNRGRLKVSVDIYGGAEAWAEPCLPYAGKEVGLYAIPETESFVWVMFRAGDYTMPVWMGGFWPKGALPTTAQGNQVSPHTRMLRSETGLQVSLNDAEEQVTISDKNGSNIITIDVNGGKVKVKANSTVVIEAQSVKLGGEAAVQKVVKGDALLQYLNLLIAAAMPKAPAVPIPPPPSFLLSTTVKTT